MEVHAPTSSSHSQPTDMTSTPKFDVVGFATRMSSFDQACTCCPYGYHIDLDFLRYLDSLYSADTLKRLKKIRATKDGSLHRSPKPQQALHARLTSPTYASTSSTSISISPTYSSTSPTYTSTSSTHASTSSTYASASSTHLSTSSSHASISSTQATSTVSESLVTCAASRRGGKEVLVELNISPEAASRERSAIQSSPDPSATAVSISPNLDSKFRTETELFISNSAAECPDPPIRLTEERFHVSRSVRTESESWSSKRKSSESESSVVAPERPIHLTLMASADEAPTPTVPPYRPFSRGSSSSPVESEASGISPAVLQAIREQMALSLHRMKELEEQVKVIPALQGRIALLARENRNLVELVRSSEASSGVGGDCLRQGALTDAWTQFEGTEEDFRGGGEATGGGRRRSRDVDVGLGGVDVNFNRVSEESVDVSLALTTQEGQRQQSQESSSRYYSVAIQCLLLDDDGPRTEGGIPRQEMTSVAVDVRPCVISRCVGTDDGFLWHPADAGTNDEFGSACEQRLAQWLRRGLDKATSFDESLARSHSEVDAPGSEVMIVLEERRSFATTRTVPCVTVDGVQLAAARSGPREVLAFVRDMDDAVPQRDVDLEGGDFDGDSGEDLADEELSEFSDRSFEFEAAVTKTETSRLLQSNDHRRIKAEEDGSVDEDVLVERAVCGHDYKLPLVPENPITEGLDLTLKMGTLPKSAEGVWLEKESSGSGNGESLIVELSRRTFVASEEISGEGLVVERREGDISADVNEAEATEKAISDAAEEIQDQNEGTTKEVGKKESERIDVEEPITIEAETIVLGEGAVINSDSGTLDVEGRGAKSGKESVPVGGIRPPKLESKRGTMSLESNLEVLLEQEVEKEEELEIPDGSCRAQEERKEDVSDVSLINSDVFSDVMHAQANTDDALILDRDAINEDVSDVGKEVDYEDEGISDVDNDAIAKNEDISDANRETEKEEEEKNSAAFEDASDIEMQHFHTAVESKDKGVSSADKGADYDDAAESDAAIASESGVRTTISEEQKLMDEKSPVGVIEEDACGGKLPNEDARDVCGDDGKEAGEDTFDSDSDATRTDEESGGSYEIDWVTRTGTRIEEEEEEEIVVTMETKPEAVDKVETSQETMVVLETRSETVVGIETKPETVDDVETSQDTMVAVETGSETVVAIETRPETVATIETRSETVVLVETSPETMVTVETRPETVVTIETRQEIITRTKENELTVAVETHEEGGGGGGDAPDTESSDAKAPSLLDEEAAVAMITNDETVGSKVVLTKDAATKNSEAVVLSQLDGQTIVESVEGAENGSRSLETAANIVVQSVEVEEEQRSSGIDDMSHGEERVIVGKEPEEEGFEVRVLEQKGSEEKEFEVSESDEKETEVIISEDKLPQVRISEEKVPEEKESEERVSEEKMPEERESEVRVFEEKVPEEKQSEERVSEEKVPEERESEVKVPEEKESEVKVSEEKVPEEKESEEGVSEGKVPEERESEVKASEEKMREERESEVKVPEEKESEVRISEEKVPEERQSEVRVTEEKMPEEKETEVQVSEERISEQKISELGILEENESDVRVIEERKSEVSVAEGKMSEENLSEEHGSEVSVSKENVSEVEASNEMQSEVSLSEEIESEARVSEVSRSEVKKTVFEESLESKSEVREQKEPRESEERESEEWELVEKVADVRESNAEEPGIRDSEETKAETRELNGKETDTRDSEEWELVDQEYDRKDSEVIESSESGSNKVPGSSDVQLPTCSPSIDHIEIISVPEGSHDRHHESIIVSETELYQLSKAEHESSDSSGDTVDRLSREPVSGVPDIGNDLTKGLHENPEQTTSDPPIADRLEEVDQKATSEEMEPSVVVPAITVLHDTSVEADKSIVLKMSSKPDDNIALDSSVEQDENIVFKADLEPDSCFVLDSSVEPDKNIVLDASGEPDKNMVPLTDKEPCENIVPDSSVETVKIAVPYMNVDPEECFAFLANVEPVEHAATSECKETDETEDTKPAETAEMFSDTSHVQPFDDSSENQSRDFHTSESQSTSTLMDSALTESALTSTSTESPLALTESHLASAESALTSISTESVLTSTSTESLSTLTESALTSTESSSTLTESASASKESVSNLTKRVVITETRIERRRTDQHGSSHGSNRQIEPSELQTVGLPEGDTEEKFTVVDTTTDPSPIPSSEAPQSTDDSQQMADDRLVVRPDVLAACAVYAEYLRDPTVAVDSDNVVSCVDFLRSHWFELSGRKASEAGLVQLHLDEFQTFGTSLAQSLINMADSDGNTAMHYAVSYGNMEVIEVLLNTGSCSVDRQNKAGYTAIMLASLLLVDLDLHEPLVLRLFHSGDVNATSATSGQTSLMLASSHGRSEMVSLLLQSGAEINLQDEDGSTALMCASEHGHSDVIGTLLSHPDCDSTITDIDGSTALSIAMEEGHHDIGVFLYAHMKAIDDRLLDEPEED